MRILQVMGTLDRGGVESMIVNLVRNGFKTDICLEIPDKGAMEEELKNIGAKSTTLPDAVPLWRNTTGNWQKLHETMILSISMRRMHFWHISRF